MGIGCGLTGLDTRERNKLAWVGGVRRWRRDQRAQRRLMETLTWAANKENGGLEKAGSTDTEYRIGTEPGFVVGKNGSVRDTGADSKQQIDPSLMDR